MRGNHERRDLFLKHFHDKTDYSVVHKGFRFVAIDAVGNQAGLSEDFVAGDLAVVGSLDGGGPLGEVDLIYVPEPATMLLLALGLLLCPRLRRR